jgi:hypothetical protein
MERAMSVSVFLNMGFQLLGKADLEQSFDQLVDQLNEFSNLQVTDVDASLDLSLQSVSLSAEVRGRNFLDAEEAGREVLTELIKDSLPRLTFEVVSSDASLARKQLIGGY